MEQLAPPPALRRAQRWLRDASRDELILQLGHRSGYLPDAEAELARNRSTIVRTACLEPASETGTNKANNQPDNVMLVPDSEMPGGERVKILDFGIAKGVSELSGPVSEDYRTNTGMVLGTATYMAPEQCKGAGNVTDKSDVYSLGVIMYRMCCGTLPFRAEGQGEVMAMHIFSTPKPLRDHDASIPRRWRIWWRG